MIVKDETLIKIIHKLMIILPKGLQQKLVMYLLKRQAKKL